MCGNPRRVPCVELSHQWELRLPLRWIAILRPQLGLTVSLAATSGITTGTDVVKALIVGADVAMMTSSAFERANYMKTLHSWTAPHELTPSPPTS